MSDGLVDIRGLIDENKIKSKFSNLYCLPVKTKEFQFNLPSGRYLVEVSKTGLIDDGGYECNYHCLDFYDLVCLFDYLIDKYKKL